MESQCVLWSLLIHIACTCSQSQQQMDNHQNKVSVCQFHPDQPVEHNVDTM